MLPMMMNITSSRQHRQLPKFGNKKVGMCDSEIEGLAIPGQRPSDGDGRSR
jgi:hypothetical protein